MLATPAGSVRLTLSAITRVSVLCQLPGARSGGSTVYGVIGAVAGMFAGRAVARAVSGWVPVFPRAAPPNSADAALPASSVFPSPASIRPPNREDT